MPASPRQEFLATYGHEEHINKFATHKFPELRAIAASSPLVSKENLDKIVDDEDPHVQYRAAYNQNLSREHFEKLSNRPDTDIRIALTKNKNFPDDLLHKLREDDSFYVRRDADLEHERRTRAKIGGEYDHK